MGHVRGRIQKFNMKELHRQSMNARRQSKNDAHEAMRRDVNDYQLRVVQAKNQAQNVRNEENSRTADSQTWCWMPLSGLSADLLYVKGLSK